MKVYECGCCGAYHRLEFDGDCRQDSERLYDIAFDDEVVSPEDATLWMLHNSPRLHNFRAQ